MLSIHLLGHHLFLNKPLIINWLDIVNERQKIDNVKNGHEIEFLDFLKKIKFCVLNGRITEEFNDFTFVSSRGKSVVDYMATYHHDLKLINKFEVKRILSCINDNDILQSISYRGSLPDHPILITEF